MLISKERHVWKLEETHWLRIGPGMGVNRTRSVGLLDPCGPRLHKGLSLITDVFVVTMSIVMTYGLGHAQTPVASQQEMSPSSTIAHVGSGESRSTSIKRPSDPLANSQC